MALPSIVYGVCWIEVEFGWGSRPSGWKLYLDPTEAKTDSEHASSTGGGEGGYIGPERPIEYYRIPSDHLPEEAKKALGFVGKWSSDDHWMPEFKSRTDLKPPAPPPAPVPTPVIFTNNNLIGKCDVCGREQRKLISSRLFNACAIDDGLCRPQK